MYGGEEMASLVEVLIWRILERKDQERDRKREDKVEGREGGVGGKGVLH